MRTARSDGNVNVSLITQSDSETTDSEIESRQVLASQRAKPWPLKSSSTRGLLFPGNIRRLGQSFDINSFLRTSVRLSGHPANQDVVRRYIQRQFIY